MSQLGSDSFIRTNVASGFGTATDGQSWVQIIPTGSSAGTTSVTSNEGVIVNNAVDTLFSLGPASGDGEVLVRFSINNTNDTLGVQLRTQNVSGSVSDYKFLWYGGNVHLNKAVSNTNTQITTTAFAVSVNTFYWMRFRLVGTTCWGKIWADGSAEPAAWTATNTDVSVTGVGTASLLGNTGTGSSGVRFDHFYAVDYPLQDLLSTSDSFSAAITAVPIDTITSTETVSESLIESITDTTLSCSDSIMFTGNVMSVTDTTTSLDSISVLLVPSIVDTTLGTTDAIISVLTVSYALLDTVLSTTDSVVGTGSTLNTAYNSGWIVLGNDTAIRANVSGGWGTSTDGQTYSITLGSGTLAVTSNELTLTASTTATYVRLGSNSSVNAEILCRMSVNNTSSNGIGVFLRQTASNTSYRCRFNPSTPSQGFALGKLVAGALTTSVTSTFTMSINTFYYIRFRVADSILYGKCWAAGSAEPAAWTLSVTDTSITATGNFGIYNSASATNNIASWDSFYCVDNVLADNAIPPNDTIADSVLFVPTESQTAIESPNDTEIYAAQDVALSILETAVYTEEFVGAEQTIANLNFYIPGDNIASSNVPFGIVQVDSLSCNESVVFFQAFVPVENNANSETFTAAITFSDQEAVISSDTLINVIVFLATDAVSLQESVAFTGVLTSIDIGITTGDSIVNAISYAPIDVTPCTEFIADIILFSWSDTVFSSDTLFSSRPVSFADDTLNISDSISMVLVQFDAWQGSLSDIPSLTETFAPFEITSETESPLYVEIFAKTDIAISVSDALLSGVPSNFLADTLTIAESIVITGSIPALLATDQLFTNDIFYVLDNFTDLNFVTESYLTTVSSNTLDPRSNLYNTIMNDNPSVYYQMTEGQFNGLFQRDGQDNVNNASNPTIIGAILSYTWAQIETSEGIYDWSLIDNDIIPWSNQGKSVIIRIHTASTIVNNLVSHYQMTATQATPSWVFNAGAPMITGADSAIYPVYWDAVYQSKYAVFITQLALRYDTNIYVKGFVASVGVNGTTSLEKSGDTTGNTLALWNPRGYSNTTWASAIHWVANQYATTFARTPILLSINNAFIAPDAIYNINYCLDVAVQHAVWALDENASVNTPHIGQQWAIVPLMTIASAPTSITGSTVALDLTVSLNDESDYAAVWESDVTTPSNQATLTTYAAKATQRFFHDIAPLQKNVTVSGEVYPTSHILTGDYLNGAQQFDGESGYGMMTVPFQGTTLTWTVKASVYPTILPTQEAIFVANGQTGVAAYGGYAMGIAAGNAGGPGQNLCAYIPGYGWYDSGYTFPASNTWYSCFMVFDGTYLTFYVNGVQTPTVNIITPYAVQPRATIGMIWDAVQLKQLRYFTGSIDEIAFYPVNISGSRIAIISAAEMGLSDISSNSNSFFIATEALTISDSSSTLSIVLSNIDTLAVSDIFAQSAINVAYLGETILINDQFNRNDQAGLGIATDGQIWTQPTNNGTLSIVYNQGQITSMSGANVMFLGSNSASLVDGRVHVTLQSGSDATIGLILRATSATQYYAARFNATNFGIVKTNGGVTTNIDDVVFTPSAGAGYWIRFRAVGNLLMAKCWIDTTSEPIAYSSVGTDSSYTTGQIGLYASTTTSADIYTFNNFFAVDNYLTDFIPVSEQYTTTEILPPFTDINNETEISFIINAEVTLDGAVTESETASYNTIMLETNELFLAASTQTWTISFTPNETLFISEALVSNSPTPLASDVLVLVDASFVINQPIIIELLPNIANSAVNFLALSLQETLLEQETFSDALVDFSATDLVFINEYPVYTSNNQLIDSVTASDSIAYTQIFVPMDICVLLDASTTKNIFFLFDVAPVIADAIINTEIFMNSDTASGDGTLDDSLTVFLIALTLIDNLLVSVDSVLEIDSQTIVDIPLSAIDNITSTGIPILVDILTPANTLSLLLAQTLLDSGITNEILLSSSPANITDITLVPTDGVLPTDIPILVDSLLINDTIFDLENQILSDSVTPIDSILPTDIPILISTVLSSDIFLDSIFFADTDNNTQSTEYLFTSIMENAVNPTTIALELTIAILSINNLIDVSTEQEILIATNIFILNDIALSPGSETIIQSLFSVTNADSSLELESILLTEIPLGLSDVFSLSDSFMSILVSMPVEILTTTEFNAIQLVAQFSESFNEIEINIFALITSLTADQITEYETLAVTLLESDSASLLPVDVSKCTDIAMNTDFVVITSDIIFNGEAFTPVEPMTTIENITIIDAIATTDTVANTENEVITIITVPVDMLIAHDLTIIDTSMEILSDALSMNDISTMQDVYVPVETISTLDTVFSPISLALSDPLALFDVSITTVNNKNNDVLVIATSIQNWVVGYFPVGSSIFLDVSTLTLKQFETDSLSVLDIAPSIGYQISDISLSIMDTLIFSAKVYITVQGTIFSGTVKGQISDGFVNGQIFSGEIQGVLP